jgi:hypothetical protein
MSRKITVISNIPILKEQNVSSPIDTMMLFYKEKDENIKQNIKQNQNKLKMV